MVDHGTREGDGPGRCDGGVRALGGAGFALAAGLGGGHQVRRPPAVPEGAADGALDEGRGIGAAEGPAQHHRAGQDGADRVGLVLAGVGRRAVRADYRLLGGQQVAIALGDYDRERPLIIDPVLAYSSYLGGSDDDRRPRHRRRCERQHLPDRRHHLDELPDGERAPGEPSPGPTPRPTRSSPSSIRPARRSSSRRYLGGTGSENNATETAGSIALDANGNVYVAGDTVSADFPTTGNAFQPSYGGGSNNPADGFLTRFTATGVLSYSTYFGGQDVDHINGLAIASDGDITFSGRTRSSQVEGFPLVNAIDTTLAGTADAFVARLESNGASLVFSTFIGGTGDEFSFYRSGHAIDAQGNVYISGNTSSVDYPTTAGAFRTVRTNATNDGFVTKLSANGQTILASTWFGGANGENLVSDVALAPTGEVVIVGETNTTAGFPLVNAYQTTFQGGIRDGFVAKLNATLTSAVFSTYFGGNRATWCATSRSTPRAPSTSSARPARRPSRWCSRFSPRSRARTMPSSRGSARPARSPSRRSSAARR